jgi:large subunit ribosomal protein L29
MKSVKPSELRAMSEEQLRLTLKETIKNLFHLRFQAAAESLKAPSEIRRARREIARIKTIQRERELAVQRAAPTEEVRGK